uniref:Uncharacterized protein n=1 Tax=Salix viminalis TaxID=40686 RepID=A0A6N2KJZ3_SALVM
MLLAAECYVNPFFMMSFRSSPKVIPVNIGDNKKGKKLSLGTIALLEKKRDKIVLQLLLEAAELDRKFQRTSDYYTEGIVQQVIKLSPLDVQSTDAITLVRQNQALLCSFLIQRLKKEQHSMHEILMHCLVFLLHSATQLYCAPEEVIDIILESAEHLNGMLTSLYHQLKEGNLQLDPEKIHGVQRQWMLLQRLVIASSAEKVQILWSISIMGFGVSWLDGYISKCKTVYKGASLPCFRSLLSIFADELAVIDYVIDKKYEDDKIEQSGIKQDMPIHQRSKAADQHGDQSFHVIYPDLSKFFPNLRKHFESLGRIFWRLNVHLKGYVAKTAKTIILYILEAIIIEHMEAMVPEIPRVVQVLVSLCRASYCCVSFLDSIIHLLKPIISYSLSKVSAEEKKLVDDSCLNFEALCFEELFLDIRQKNESQDLTAGKDCSRALTIFILASVFGDFLERNITVLNFVGDFTSFEPTTSFHDYLCAFQTVLESCKILLVKTLRVFGVCQLQVPHVSDNSTGTLYDSRTENHSWFLSDVFHNSCEPKISEELESNIFDDIASKQKDCNLSVEEIEDFSNALENLIAKLNPNIELCWNLHHQLAKKLTITSAQCLMYSRCLSSIVLQVQNTQENESEKSSVFKPVDWFLVHWRIGLEALAEVIMKLQESHCWEVASLMLDCLLGVPCCFPLDNVINIICSNKKFFMLCTKNIVALEI